LVDYRCEKDGGQKPLSNNWWSEFTLDFTKIIKHLGLIKDELLNAFLNIHINILVFVFNWFIFIN